MHTLKVIQSPTDEWSEHTHKRSTDANQKFTKNIPKATLFEDCANFKGDSKPIDKTLKQTHRRTTDANQAEI